MQNIAPAPIGVTVSHSNLRPGHTTRNFMLAEGGLYAVTVEMDGTAGDQVVLNTTTGTAGLDGGTNTAVLTMSRTGLYNYMVPFGGQTLNFTTVNFCRAARVTRMF